jgi:nucleoside recognition membrane protein YjiH
MKKFHIFVFKIKRNIIPGIFLLFTICLVLFSSSNMGAAKSGLKLWANSVVPSLFPFFIATEVLSKTNIPKYFGKLFNKIMKPLFNISGEGSFALIMGWLSRISCWS